MPSPIELSLFDFVDEFATEISKDGLNPLDTLAANSRIIEFCESFFVQFFANVLHTEIEGFDSQSKRAASGIAIALKDDKTKKLVRVLIALFEKFCDMHADVIGGAYGAAEITYTTFHRQYIQRLLRRAAEWAKMAQLAELEARIVQSQKRYDEAAKSRKW
jgi:hypothetical protein